MSCLFEQYMINHITPIIRNLKYIHSCLVYYIMLYSGMCKGEALALTIIIHIIMSYLLDIIQRKKRCHKFTIHIFMSKRFKRTFNT